MTVYDRLLMELSNRQYLTEEQYKQYLIEQDLTPTDTFVKADMYKRLLLTVVDILEATMNDTDTMTTISTEFGNIGQAYQYLETRAQSVRDRIAAIPLPEEETSAFSLMYTRGGSKTMGGFIKPINRAVIDDILEDELGKYDTEEDTSSETE